MSTTTELDPRDVCFALVEGPVNGVVMRVNPRMQMIAAVKLALDCEKVAPRCTVYYVVHMLEWCRYICLAWDASFSQHL